MTTYHSFNLSVYTRNKRLTIRSILRIGFVQRHSDEARTNQYEEKKQESKVSMFTFVFEKYMLQFSRFATRGQCCHLGNPEISVLLKFPCKIEKVAARTGLLCGCEERVQDEEKSRGGYGRRNHRADSARLCFHFPPQDRQSRGRQGKVKGRGGERERENKQVLTSLELALNRSSNFSAVIFPAYGSIALTFPEAGEKPHRWRMFLGRDQEG